MLLEYVFFDDTLMLLGFSIFFVADTHQYNMGITFKKLLIFTVIDLVNSGLSCLIIFEFYQNRRKTGDILPRLRFA